MSKSSYAPDEDSKMILLERTFVAGDFLNGVGYGTQLVLYATCARYLWETRKRRSQSRFILAYITLLLAVETVYQSAQAHTVQMVYVDNRNYPGGPWRYFMARQDLPVKVIFLASYFTVTLLSDLLVFWRCWVIWTAMSKPLTVFLALLFPAFLLVASLVLGILWTLQSSQPGLSLYSTLPLAYGTSYYAISLGVNIILTVLITGRLIQYRRAVNSVLPTEHSRAYTSLMAIVVESASLYSVFATLFLITYAMDHPMNQIFLSVANSAQQIANYLIIYRVAQGCEWRPETLAGVTDGGLSFATAPPQSQSQQGLHQSDSSSNDDGRYRNDAKGKVATPPTTPCEGLESEFHMYERSRVLFPA